MPDDPTLPWRIAGGMTIFAVLAWYDWRKNPENPTRIREYAFLFGVTLAAMIYGIAHDLVTYALSPDYYVYGKGITSAATGWNTDVALLAMQATWTGGLIGGAVLLIANNPSRGHVPVPYPTLLRYALVVLAVSACTEVVVGIAAWMNADAVRGWWGASNFRNVVDDRFVLVLGMHWGAYGGAVAGLVVAYFAIRMRVPS
ncbi:MAG: hypothetical protein GC168_08975 [Candidatus Hydrogenedens sp.]|nr:hypothetical protein [Candidatus Hydrogenedens sp.]